VVDSPLFGFLSRPFIIVYIRDYIFSG